MNKKPLKSKIPKPPHTGDAETPPEYANVIPDKAAIIKQYIKEKEAAVKVRQVKINNWIKDEEAYNGVIQKTLITRSNYHVPIVFEGVQNMKSKVGTDPDVKYETIPEGDENASDIMEHVVKEDLAKSSWKKVFSDSKVECGIYSRTIYQVIPGNDRNKVDLIDTMAYLISPIAKNTKDALYQGHQFIYKTFDQLKKEAKKFEYDMQELKRLQEEKVLNETQQDSSTEASLKNIRLANMGLSNVTQYGSKVAEITQWETYIKGKLHRLTVANDQFLLRCVPMIDLGLERPSYVSWGTFTRGIAFWGCPSIADIYRDTNLVIDTSLNQVIDNNTYRNFGQLVVASSSGLKQSSIVPRPLGITSITVEPNGKIADKVWQIPVPEIGNGVEMVQIVKGFADNAAGLAPASSGQKGKVSVTMQAKLNADLDAKISDMRMNATIACQELYQMMSDITKKRLTTPRKVKIFGYKSLTLNNVTKKNFEDVDFVAKAIPAEDSVQNKQIKQKAKIDLYELFKDDPMIPGQIAMRRSVAKTFDIDPSEIEAWFTKEEQPQQDNAVLPPEEGADKGTDSGAKPLNESTPLISQTSKNAAALVPKTIQPNK